ncbi:MAG TPA: hypothetical protein EYG03_01245 [Planctomycetes bacterium]|nr:hypothetical protein [Fuerstiella sp.]HIK90607.1 hypothetical protein [Planctomycetota bacterium]
MTEHCLRLYESPDGSIYLPHVPEQCGQPIFGPRLLAMIGWMKSQAHCSYTTIEEYFDDVLKVPVSRGYLSKLCTDVISGSLADAYEEVWRAIPQQPLSGRFIGGDLTIRGCARISGNSQECLRRFYRPSAVCASESGRPVSSD